MARAAILEKSFYNDLRKKEENYELSSTGPICWRHRFSRVCFLPLIFGMDEISFDRVLKFEKPGKHPIFQLEGSGRHHLRSPGDHVPENRSDDVIPVFHASSIS